jgi:hypothetical protein
MGAAHTTATAPRQPMAALARGLGAACRISVARLRPAESDVRGRSSTWSKTFGAVRQVRGGAEAGFWVVCWVAPGSLRRLAAVAGRRSGVEGRYAGSLRGQGVCSDCFGPLTRRERLLTARMVVLVLVRRLGVWGAPSGPLCGAGASRAHARNGGFRPRPDPHACHASGARVCAD